MECGTENPENANFCENCGKLLSNTSKGPVKSPKPPRKSNTLLLIVILFIAAIIGTTGLYIATHSNVMVSGGMEPVIYRGDIIVVDQNPGSVQVGDIVVYNATWYPRAVIHRVKQIYETPDGKTYLIMKGDNNPVPDPEPVLYPDQVISKAVSINGQPLIIPKLGYPILWIRGL